MNTRLQPVAKSILISIANQIAKNKGVAFVIGFFLCLAVIWLCTEKFNVQAYTGETNEPLSQNEISELNPRMVANLSLAIIVAQDGLAPMNNLHDMLNGRDICPANPSAGCDFSSTDGIVRTNDKIIYTYDYGVNAEGDDITVTATAPPGTVWDFLPGFCYAANDPNPGDPGSSLTGDGTPGNPSTITCRRRMKTSGTAESLPFTAVVSGTTLNGASLNASGAVSGPNSVTMTAAAPEVRVSAAPRFNLRKDLLNYGGNDADGYRIQYLATVGVFSIFNGSGLAEPNPRYGSSILDGPSALTSTFTFTDVVSSVSSPVSPKAQLMGCDIYSRYNRSPSLGITCTQPGGIGEPVVMTVTNADTSLSQYDTFPGDGVFAIAAFSITVFIPPGEITARGHTIKDILENFNPVSPTGQQNFSTDGENIIDNSVTLTVINPLPGSGIFGKTFVTDYNNGSGLGFDALVAPGQKFASQVLFFNDTQTTLSNVVLCDVMDRTKYSVIEAFPGTVHSTSGQVPDTIEFTDDYANPDPNWVPIIPGSNLNEIRNECQDSPTVNWRPITAFLSNLSSITKFRVKYNSLPPSAEVSVRVRVQARDSDLNGQTIFTGTYLPNLGAWRNGNNMFDNNDQYRLILARGTVRITKETESNNTVNSIETGNANGIGFVLKPTLSPVTGAGPFTPVQVTVMDILPIGLTYKDGTAQQNGVDLVPLQIPCTASGVPDSRCTGNGQHLIWTLNDQVPGAAIHPIIFRATADLTVSNNEVLTNKAIVSSPVDPSEFPFRTTTRSIIGASPSTFLIYKATNKPQIDVNGSFLYTVTYTNASFLTDFSGIDFIDILPFNGDGTLPFGSGTHIRTPPTAFNPAGTLTLNSLSATGGTPVWYFTKAPAASINLSPKDSSNLNPGTPSSIWCAGTSAGPNPGGLPPHCDGFSLATSTAVRMQDTAVMLRDNTIRSFTLNFTTSGNQANDRYTNNSGGSVAEITLPVSSLNVPVVVLNSSIAGTVWFDTNSDGSRLSAETGRIVGSTVTLSGTTAGGVPVSQTTTTNATGNYSFTGLLSGNYTVQFGSPANYTASPADRGIDDTVDSDGDASTLTTETITLGVNDRRSTTDQGFYQLNLGGTVWNDSDNNGNLGPGETGISGLSVELLDSSGVVILPAQMTDSNGNYSFTNLSAGNYRVRINSGGRNPSSVFYPNPNDDVDSDNNGTMLSGSVISNEIALFPGTEPIVNHTDGTTFNDTLDFGLLLAPTAGVVTLGGRVVTSDGHGISKASVTMIDENGVIHQAVTNPFGIYQFTDVPAGTVVIIHVKSRSHTFEPNIQTIRVMEDSNEINFAAIN